ncbi:energy transducer TonB, partial [Pontixanthobacter sp.]|uniref:energy transducer TonB n=1 Tax=Pontixanthobacter sp. TaxID=2792078 RepID=UPI003C7D9043
SAAPAARQQPPRRPDTAASRTSSRTASRTPPRTSPPAPPAAARRSGGNRVGADFLPGSGESTTTAETRAPASNFGPSERAALGSAIRRQLRPHWSGRAPQGLEAEQLVTVLSWEMNPDGSLKGPPRVLSQSGITDANRAQAQRHAEIAIRAVQLAAPFDLPEEFYDRWKLVRDWQFDRRL